jgi:hypothetical protein
VSGAAQRGDIVVTSDKDDLAELAAHATNVRVEAI